MLSSPRPFFGDHAARYLPEDFGARAWHFAHMADAVHVPLRWKWVRQQVRSLHAERDCERIVALLYDWRRTPPMGVHLQSLLGFMRQCAVPAIAEVLYRGGRGKLLCAARQRADDTMCFMGEWIRYGPSSALGASSLERLNDIHAAFPITNEQYIYTLTTFAVHPQLLFEMVGDAGYDAHEQRALACFWRSVAQRMRLVDVPESFAAMLEYLHSYELSNFQTTPAGQACAEALLAEFVARWYARPLHALGRAFALAHCDERLRSVFAFDYPSGAVTVALRKMVRLRLFMEDHVLPDCREPAPILETFRRGFGQYGFEPAGCPALGTRPDVKF